MQRRVQGCRLTALDLYGYRGRGESDIRDGDCIVAGGQIRDTELTLIVGCGLSSRWLDRDFGTHEDRAAHILHSSDDAAGLCLSLHELRTEGEKESEQADQHQGQAPTTLQKHVRRLPFCMTSYETR